MKQIYVVLTIAPDGNKVIHGPTVSYRKAHELAESAEDTGEYAEVEVHSLTSLNELTR